MAFKLLYLILLGDFIDKIKDSTKVFNIGYTLYLTWRLLNKGQGGRLLNIINFK